MSKISIPKFEYMPSFIEALKHGYKLDNDVLKSSSEILEIENNTEEFFQSFVKTKTTPILTKDKPDAKPIERSEFWCVEGNTYVGRLNIRHGLNDALLLRVGNIGFEVVPDQQRKGYASEMIQWGLEFLRNKTDLQKALLTTADNNTASIHCIEKNGGVLADKVQRDENTLTRRYWITL